MFAAAAAVAAPVATFFASCTVKDQNMSSCPEGTVWASAQSMQKRSAHEAELEADDRNSKITKTLSDPVAPEVTDNDVNPSSSNKTQMHACTPFVCNAKRYVVDMDALPLSPAQKASIQQQLAKTPSPDKTQVRENLAAGSGDGSGFSGFEPHEIDVSSVKLGRSEFKSPGRESCPSTVPAQSPARSVKSESESFSRSPPSIVRSWSSTTASASRGTETFGGPSSVGWFSPHSSEPSPWGGEED